jgi:hypothetical protein
MLSKPRMSLRREDTFGNAFGEFGQSQRGVLLSEDISIPTQKIPTTRNVGVRSGHYNRKIPTQHCWSWDSDGYKNRTKHTY